MANSIIEAIVSAFGVLPKIAVMFVQAFQSIFMNASTVEGVTTYSGLNDFGICLLVFAGFGIVTGIIAFVRSLFTRKMS